MLQRLARGSFAASRSRAVCVGGLKPTRIGCTTRSSNTSQSSSWNPSTTSWASSNNCNSSTCSCSSSSSSSNLGPSHHRNIGYGQTRCFATSAAPAEAAAPTADGSDAAATSAAGDSSNTISLRSNIDMRGVYRHHWAVPVVGFGTRLVLPLHSFEAWEDEEVKETEFIGPLRDLRATATPRHSAPMLWRGLEQALSAKFAQEQLVLVRDFNLTTHKTKHCVKHLRRLLGPRCNSALLIHEGHDDVNENFRWATAHITGVRRTDVAGVNAYTLLKHRMAIITIKALKQLLYELHQQQQQRLPRYATPDGLPAPPPPQVPGWAQDWIELKTKEREAKFDRRRMRELAAKWKWSSDPKGLLKLPRVDPLRGFRLGRFSSEDVTPPGSKYDDLYADEDPLDEEGEDLEKLAAALEAREHEEALRLTNGQDTITNGESL